jgi:hypothetical protein
LQAPSRQSLIRTIQAFLESDITAFEFDERLDAFRDSDDLVIQHVVEAVWYHYDDFDDHFVCITKSEWDYFQRLLLVLASDCRIEQEAERQWSFKQLIAATSLCAFLYFAWQTGWGNHLFLLAIPFGFISIALSSWHRPVAMDDAPYRTSIFPFATFADLATAYRSTGFRKSQYPKQIASRTIRSPFMAAFWQLHAFAVWLMLSPIPLLFQTLPDTRMETRVVAAS